MSEVLIVVQPLLGVGGIETYFYNLMKGNLIRGRRVIWLCDENPRVDDSFDDLLAMDGFEVVSFRSEKTRFPKRLQLNLHEEDRVAIICAYTRFLLVAERLKKRLACRTVDAFYLMPHFVGALQFPERVAPRFMQPMFRSWYRDLVLKWLDNGEYLFFDQKHIDALTENYSISRQNLQSLIVPCVRETRFFDDRGALAKAKTRNEQFRIVCSSRFEFPHKGFILGVLDDFAELKSKYSQVTLTIVGDGPGKDDVERKLACMTDDVQSSIELLGFLSPSQFDKVLEDAHLHVSLAGCLTIGARCGTLSLPARHYTNDFQTPGFYSASSFEGGMVTSPCDDGMQYLIEAIEVPDDKFVDLSRESFEAEPQQEPDFDFFFRMRNATDQGAADLKDRMLLKLLMLLIHLRSRVGGTGSFE